MNRQANKKYLIFSVIAHIGLLLIFVLGLDTVSTVPVIENTNKNDVISAVILGDSQKSKILPQTPPANPAPPPVVKEEPKPTPPPPKVKPEEPAPKPVAEQQKKPEVVPVKEDTIALKKAEKKKKLAEQKAQKALEEKKLHEMLAKDFLADLSKMKEQQKKVKPKALTSQFEKTLREQAEKSLRDQLLNEEIKLKGTQSRQAQGEVNKFKALILQAISEHWVVPTQANKKLYCELMIRVAPGGVVLDVQITKSSGDPSLDSSARVAVLKASPLPVPKDSDAFDAFRQFVLKVKPENILS